MVKVGFIVEGDTEKKIINSENFREFLFKNDIEPIPSVYPERGRMGKDVFKNNIKLETYINLLKDRGAKYIFVIRDLEDLDCIVLARNEIKSENVTKIIIEKTVESWFLADIKSLNKTFKIREPDIEFPEKIVNPFETLRQISLKNTNRGISDKLIFASKMLNNGFSIENAANHPNCDSAKYFINKLKSIAN